MEKGLAPTIFILHRYLCRTLITESRFFFFQVLVRYIDYGNFEIVDQGKLVVLPPSLSQQPACAKEFDLNLKPCFIDESSIKYKQVSFNKVYFRNLF